MSEAPNHINYPELLAAYLALQCFVERVHNITILLKMDNVTAVMYINKIPGEKNTVADEKSRNVKNRCDWMLNPLVFKQILTLLGPLEIDLCASCLTKQLPRFYSWRPDPEAKNMDAFSQDWSKAKSFANPPWCLIDRSLQQIK